MIWPDLLYIVADDSLAQLAIEIVTASRAASHGVEKPCYKTHFGALSFDPTYNVGPYYYAELAVMVPYVEPPKLMHFAHIFFMRKTYATYRDIFERICLIWPPLKNDLRVLAIDEEAAIVKAAKDTFGPKVLISRCFNHFKQSALRATNEPELVHEMCEANMP
jgi:hypothetical protein